MISKCEPVPIIPMYWSVIIEFDAGYTQLQASPADLQHLLPCTAVENLVQEFGATSPTLNLTSCFVSSDYYQSNARSQVCRSDKCAAVCSIHCTSLQDPGHAGGMLELQLKKTYLFCRVQGRRSKVFLCSAHLCRSQMGTVRLFRRTSATGLSLVRIRSC